MSALKYCVTLCSILMTSIVLGQEDPELDSLIRSWEVENMPQIVHYSGTYKGLRSNGHILYDSLEHKQQVSMWAASFEDSTIFVYRLTQYHPNESVKFDSLVDFSRKRVAFLTLIEQNAKGKLTRRVDLKAKLDPKRTDLPLRTETLWYGKEIRYDEDRNKTVTKIEGETR